MGLEHAAARIAGTAPWRQERLARSASAFSLAEAAFRVAGFDKPCVAILRKKFREDKDRAEWALMDSAGKQVLRWFGTKRPSKERVKKEERRVQFFKHQGSDAAVADVTYKSAPEYSSVEDFVQYKMDDEDDSFDHEDLAALNYRLKQPVKEVRKSLEGYGLSLKQREPEKKPRGFQSPDLDRWYGPGSAPTHGGGGSGTKWIPSAT